MTHTILIVDDDEHIRKVTAIYLENEGYQTIKATNGNEALSLIEQHGEGISLVLLDVMMPGMTGIETCLKIRELYTMPIIFLSAKSEDMDKIQGLASGADDYVTKPFNALELLARVKSQLRRSTKYSAAPSTPKNLIEIGALTINTDTRQVFVGQTETRLTPKEFDILELLARNKGMVFSIEKIYERVWGEQYFGSDNTVMVHITKIRDKIEENPKKPIYIKTVWGVGYKI